VTMGSALVILPTYNESENIISVVRGVLDSGGNFEALVVDDDSPDGTAAAVRGRFGAEARVHMVVRTGPRGRGLAGAEGFKWALERGYEFVFEMDADGSHDPAVLPELLDALGRADVAVASRLAPGGGERGRGLFRRLVTLAANSYLRIVLGLKVRDCTSGFRGFRRVALEAVPWEKVGAAGPAIVQEVLYAVASRGFSIEEVPFVFVERAEGRSKLNFRILFLGLIEAFWIRGRMAPFDSRAGHP
jgi:dolichol-phosphate mannosyltransferase